MKQERYAEIFAEKMKQYLRRAKVRQLYLATLLEVTPSAISQMVKCRILMNSNQLNVVGKGLELSDDELLEMQILLSKVRNGESAMRTPFNRFIKTCRREKKLSMSKVAQLTGISTVRIKSFENDFNTVFTAEDAEKLGAVYGIAPEIIMNKLPEVQNVFYPQGGNIQNTDAEVADSAGAAYTAVPRVPVVAMDDFRNYSAEIDLFVFGDMRSCEELLYCADKKVIGVKARAEYFNLPFGGEMVFFVTDKKPLTYVCSLFLCLDYSRTFRILLKQEDSDDFFFVNSSGVKERFTEKIRWSLGIIDIKTVPDLLV